jgi:hypothetical protein
MNVPLMKVRRVFQKKILKGAQNFEKDHNNSQGGGG